MQHIIVDQPALTICYNYSHQWLHTAWRGPYDQEATRTACALLLDALSQWPATKLLVDHSEITLANMQFTQWGVAWMHDMYVAGLRCLAWVYAANFSGRSSADHMIRLIQRPVVASFDNLAAAQAWLCQQKVLP